VKCDGDCQRGGSKAYAEEVEDFGGGLGEGGVDFPVSVDAVD